METRREFLTHSAGLVAGLSMVPGLRPPAEASLNAVQLAVRNEIPMLISEIHTFRNSLPVLLSPPISDVPPNAVNHRPGGCRDAVAGLHHWQRAADHLMQALLGLHRRVPDPAALEAFVDFHTTHALCYKQLLDSFDEPDDEPIYELAAGWPPIRWKFDPPEVGLHHAHAARSMLSAVNGREFDPWGDPWDDLTRQLPQVRRLIEGLPADFNEVMRAYAYWLPGLANVDPEFAIDALDYQKLQIGRLKDSPAAKTGGQFLTDAYTTAVAFVAVTLANNHFPKIRRLLEKPGIGGYWAMVIPSLLSAVLYHKVMTLRDLARAA